MTGPEHFKEAEKLVGLSHEQELPCAAVTAQAAQVHATLALAAATAIQPSQYASGRPEADAWQKVCGVKA